MSRWVKILVCIFLGVVMLVCGLLVPIYLRAVDASVLQKAGRNTPSLVQRGLVLVKGQNLGAAELLLQTARQEVLPDREELRFAVTNLAWQHPGWQAWGGGDQHLQLLFGRGNPPPVSFEPLTDWAVRLQNRETALGLLRASPRSAAQELLRCRELTNTVVFSPSASASGQALDAALSVCGLLLEESKLTPALSNAVFVLAAQARVNPEPLEQVLLDLMSLGQRFNWAQLAEFVNRIEDVETLHRLAGFVRRADPPLSVTPADGAPASLPAVLFSAVELSGKPDAVANYLVTFSQSGLQDLRNSLRYGAGGVNELLRRNQRYYTSTFRRHAARQFPFSAFFALALNYCWRTPWMALTLKWLLYLAGGFMLAAAVHYGRPAVPLLEQPLQVRGLHFAREVLFALGFLLVLLLVSEPFLAQESQKAEHPFKLGLRVSMAGSAVLPGMTNVKSSLMNEPIILTLLLFFVLQGLLYTACLVKLAEIRRQRVASRIKLKLLENEDHLFDAGLYLGFVGTIISLILFSVGVIKPSLMAAYSSTSFGIIFVSLFKIFHLRPARRKLLLDAEAASEPAVHSAAPAYATPS